MEDRSSRPDARHAAKESFRLRFTSTEFLSFFVLQYRDDCSFHDVLAALASFSRTLKVFNSPNSFPYVFPLSKLVDENP